MPQLARETVMMIDAYLYVLQKLYDYERIQDNMASCLRAKRIAERQYSESVSYKCWQGKAETEVYMGEKSIKKIILSE